MITVEQVKELRARTGLSVMQCRKALDETGGDLDKAVALLKKAGVAAAEEKSDRSLGSGIVQSYIHSNGTIGSIVELSCETDFVAKNEEFKNLAYDIAMQVAATDPQFLKIEDMTSEAGEGTNDLVLAEQFFIKDPQRKIKDLITEAVQKFGERIEIRRFVRFSTQS
jgi:elongation factor Ts